MTNDDMKYKPTGYSYRVDENVWAGEYPVWEWEQGAPCFLPKKNRA